MRILVLGAGAIGGYCGGRLIEAGIADEVAFLVRPGRKAQLDRDGLRIESAAVRSFSAPNVRTLLAGEVRPGWDVVLLTCKAYDLEEAIETIRPAVDGRTAVLPLLNGISHVTRLEEAFGPGRVLGGLAFLSTTLTPGGTIRQLTPLNKIVFGELNGQLSERVRTLKAMFGAAPLEVEAADDVQSQMWEKLVGLGTLAAATVLMRANLGEIARAPGGITWLERLLDRGAAAAEAHGHAVRRAILDGFMRPMLRDTNSVLTASMLCDLEAGGRIEADHVLGFLLEAVRCAGVPDDQHETAYLHAKAYENRRAASR